MVERVEVRAEAPGDLAAVLQLRRQSGRGCGGEEQTSGVAPSRCSVFLPDIGAAEGGRGAAESSWREVTV